MSDEKFDAWLRELDLSYWGTAQHKVSPSQFFQQRQKEGAVLLDLRSPEEEQMLIFPFALLIPLAELPDRLKEIPRDRLVATFCSSATRAVVAWAYLQIKGYSNVRILDAHYADLTEELKPGKVYQMTN
jgi:rhodanese-related sulfurtransferase